MHVVLKHNTQCTPQGWEGLHKNKMKGEWSFGFSVQSFELSIVVIILVCSGKEV